MSKFLIPKALYIALYSLYGSALGYISIYYSEALHLSSNQIGMLLAISPFVQVVACPLWTVIADRNPRFHGPTMAILASIGGSSVLMLYFLPEWVQDNDISDRVVMLITCICAFIFAFFGSPICALVDSAVLQMLGDEKILYGSQRLWGSVSNGLHLLGVGLLISMYGINIAFAVFLSGLVTFVTLSLFVQFDHQMVATTNNDNRLSYDMHDAERESLLSSTAGRPNGNYMYNPATTPERLYSTSTSTMHRHDSNTNTVYLDEQPSLTNLSTLAMNVQMEANQELQSSPALPSLGLAISYIPTIDTSLSALGTIHDNLPQKSILKSVLVYSFLISILLYGLAFSMMSQFLFLLLRDLGTSPSLLGWIGPIGGTAEVLTFWFARKLFDTYSVTFLMSMAQLSFIFRALIYTCLNAYETKSIIIALSLQLINGFSYAMVWTIAVAEVDSFFPVEQRSIAQGILAAMFSGLGYGFGCIFGGVIYSVYGTIKLYQVSAFICGLSLIVFLTGRSTIIH